MLNICSCYMICEFKSELFDGRPLYIALSQIKHARIELLRNSKLFKNLIMLTENRNI